MTTMDYFIIFVTQVILNYNNMPKQRFDRYLMLIDYVMKQPRSMEELTQHFNVDRHTIYEWKKYLKNELQIEVINNNGRFELTDESKESILKDSLNSWRLNTVSLMSLLDKREVLKDRILLEHIPSSSNLEPILEAMEQNHWISFDYVKYYNNPELKSERHERIEPYCVKLFERRWYVICHTTEKKSKDDNGMRTFSLDQISNLTVMKTPFELPEAFTAEDYFKDVYGITTGMNGPLQTIELKVTNARANYFRALPLHHSQKELVEKKDDDYSYFTYELCPSNDFYQALLHHAEHVEVLSPTTVREEMAKKVLAMAEKYSKPPV